MSNTYSQSSSGAYGAPARSSNPSAEGGGGGGGGAGGAFSTGTTTGGPGTAADDRDRRVKYKCADCDSEVQIGRGDPIRCLACGHRVLYKIRTNRMVQFEAR